MTNTNAPSAPMATMDTDRDRVEEAKISPLEAPEVTRDELGLAEIEGVAGGLKYAGYNHNQNVAAGEAELAGAEPAETEEIELETAEMEALAGGIKTSGTYFNHNQNVAG